jgi:hypothetical protein
MSEAKQDAVRIPHVQRRSEQMDGGDQEKNGKLFSTTHFSNKPSPTNTTYPIGSKKGLDDAKAQAVLQTRTRNLNFPRVLRYPSKPIGLFIRRSIIFDSNGEDLEGYPGVGLYDSMPMDEEDPVVLPLLMVDGNFCHSTFSCVARAGSAIEELYGSPQDIDGMIFAWFMKRKKNKKEEEEVGQRSWDFIVGSTFLYGIKALADYVHAKSLKLGIYFDARISTCQGRPGSLFHENNDAE